MITGYYPEMNQAKPADVQGEVSLSHYGKHYFVKTPLELKGRGVTLDGEYNEANCLNPAKYGWKSYRVTTKAMEMLEKKYNFSMEILLD